MTKTNRVSRTTTAVLAIIFLIPALVLFIMWSSIGLKVTGISQQEKLTTYLGYFPSWLQSISTIYTISIACCVIAIIFATRSFSKHLLSVRVMMLLTVLVAIFILLFDIYQMLQ